MVVKANTDARRLDQRVGVEKLTQEKDDTGYPVPTWTQQGEAWAAVDAPLATDTERYVTQGLRTVHTQTFWFRSDVVIGLEMDEKATRLKWADQIFDVQAIPDRQRRARLLAVVATTGLTEG